MNDNDLIRRRDVLKKAIYLCVETDARVVFEQDIKEIPAAQQEMSAREFIEALDKICDFRHCSSCPLEDACECEYGCISYDLPKALTIIEAWVREHPDGGKR